MIQPVSLTSMLKEVYAPMVHFQFPELVDRYGIDAVWEALSQGGPVCATDQSPDGCGHDGCHFDCGCVCS